MIRYIRSAVKLGSNIRIFTCRNVCAARASRSTTASLSSWPQAWAVVTQRSAQQANYCDRMSSTLAVVKPLQLDKSQFDRSIQVGAVKVPKKLTTQAVKLLSQHMLNMDLYKLRHVVTPEPDDGTRIVLLHQDTKDAELSGASAERAAAIRAAVAALRDAAGAGAGAGAGAEGGVTLVNHTVHYGYDNMNAEQVLHALLPAAAGDVPTSFELVGHLAHLNLRDEALPYKYLIGQVILEKNANLRTVVNKTGTIGTVFRTFPMEVLAGEDDTTVTVRQTGAIFSFDFRHVYWNSRLQQEHDFMVRKVIAPGSCVADMFCGVGPFAVPLGLDAHRGGPQCTVHANDLNPASYAALVENVKKNKADKRVTCYNMDGREFIRYIVRGQAPTASTSVGGAGSNSSSSASSASSAVALPAVSPPVPFKHVLMNLPADAISFLDVFVGVYHGVSGSASSSASSSSSSSGSSGSSGSGSSGSSSVEMPMIHCYCFSKSDTELEAAEDVVQRVCSTLQLPVPAPASAEATAAFAAAAATDPTIPPWARSSSATVISPRLVSARASGVLPDLVVRGIRDVAPKKIMLCVSFTLPHAAAYAAPAAAAAASEGAAAAAAAAAQEDADSEQPAAKRARIGE